MEPVEPIKPTADARTILAQMTTLYAEGRFERTGEVIKNLDLEEMETPIILAWMSACRLPKDYGDTLPNRDEFLARCKAELTNRHHDELVDELVRDLM